MLMPGQLKILRQLITASFIDQVAIRKDLVQKNPSGVKYTTPRGVPYQAIGISEDVYIHPSSVIMAGPPPDYVVFLEVVRTTRVWIKGAWYHLGEILTPFLKYFQALLLCIQHGSRLLERAPYAHFQSQQRAKMGPL
jgi:hypothetical protein